MTNGGERPDPSDGELLRQWEAKIASEGDPLGALADLLSQGTVRRSTLFQRVGERVLGCELRSILGAGGMGVTYGGVAADGAAVAVKMVLGVGGSAAARFEQECRLLQSFDHSAIVRYRDHAVLDDGSGVLVMDRVDGVDLEQLLQDVLRDAPPSSEPGRALLHEVEGGLGARVQSPRYRRRILRLLATVADGLEAAHKRGVVHRDVKPANVLVRDDLSPVLIDFGLARDQQIKVSFTASGAAMGTLAYMAPEQLGRDPGAVDARTDVYALGLILFRALLGREARDDVKDVVRAANQPFLLDARQSRTLPVDLQAILYRCLDPRPARRYPTMQAFADDLRAAAGAGAVAARRPGLLRRLARDRAMRRIVVLGVTVIGLLAAVSAWPRGREVVFAANVEAADALLMLDNAMPVALGDPVALSYGSHIARLTGPRLQAREVAFDVVPGPGRQWVSLRTRYEDRTAAELKRAGRAIVQFTSGQSYVPVVPGQAPDQRWVDDAPIADWSPFTPESLLAPGVHVFRARDGRGHEETQRLLIGDAPEDVVLLPASVAQVGGMFRRTLATVHSPRPDDLTIAGTAQSWLGPAKLSDVGAAGNMLAACSLAPSARAEWCEATLRVDLPKPMRSAVAFVRGSVSEGGELEVQAGFAGEPLARWPMQTNGVLAPLQQFRSVSGSAAFVVRARMRATTAATPVLALARFLEGGLFGGHWRAEPPCFALVADPDPEVAVLPSAPVDALLAAPVLDARWLADLASDREASAMTWFARPGGGRELLIGMTADVGGLGEVRRYDWPSLTLRDRLPATAMHERTQPLDGKSFGGGLCVVPDGDGDGIADLIVGDSSSARRGTVGSGTVARLGSTGGAPKWAWPLDASSAAFQDDGAAASALAGDWNGDGRDEVVVGANYAWGPDGPEKAGMVAVVDALTGVESWRRFGDRDHGCMHVAAVHPAPPGKPSTLLLAASLRVAGQELDLGSVASLRLGGVEGRDLQLPEMPPNASYVLAGAARDAEPSVVLIRAGAWHDGFQGLQRFAVVGGALRLVASAPLVIAAPPLRSHVMDLYTAALPDLDGDGFTDASFGLLEPDRARVVVVSCRALKVLGVADVTMHLAGQTGNVPPIVAYDAAGRPDELLLVGVRDERRFTSRLVSVRLPR